MPSTGRKSENLSNAMIAVGRSCIAGSLFAISFVQKLVGLPANDLQLVKNAQWGARRSA
jgi:hypothetical protein